MLTPGEVFWPTASASCRRHYQQPMYSGTGVERRRRFLRGLHAIQRNSYIRNGDITFQHGINRR
jgi:hypothetical protein